MRAAKWIENVEPDKPISKVARKAIDIRLKIVVHYLRLAAKQAHRDIKYVHQLRVATRRADSALRLFEDVLPRTRRQWIKRQLKQIRNVAGNARDLDVLCQRLRRDVSDSAPNAWDGIIQSIGRQRQRAQRPLLLTWKRMKTRQFQQHSEALAKRVRWRGKGAEPTFHDLAVTKLRPLVNDFFQAGDADLRVPENLHQLRLAGKRLRYGLELLAAGLDPSIRRDVYPVFAEIQETLGEINDHVVAEAIFETWLVQASGRKTTDEIAKLIGIERADYRAARQRFDEWWTAETVARLKSQFNQVLDPTGPTDAVKAFLA